MATVTEVWRYPVKSMAGERLERCMVTEQGLEGDRRWAFIDRSPNRDGKWFNIKQHSPLMTYHARLAGRALEVVAADGSVVDLHEDLLQAPLALLQRHELDFCSCQIPVGRHDIDPIHHI